MLAPVEINPAEIFHHHHKLPPLPEVVNKIQAMQKKESSEIRQIAELVRSDSALSAQVLKVVNSAYYGLSREISDIKFAVAYLGINEIYRMVLSLSVIYSIGVSEREELRKFWFHSFYTSLCSRHLAKKYANLLEEEELWSAALLHDLGKLVYIKFYPEHYQTITTYAEKHGCLFEEAESHYSYPASSYLGGLLCDYWNLPQQIKWACEYHNLHDLKMIKGDTLDIDFKRMICLGSLFTRLANNKLNQKKKKEIADTIMKALNCTKEKFLIIMAEIYELRLKVDSFMGEMFINDIH